MCKDTWLALAHTEVLTYTLHSVLEAMQAASMGEQERHMHDAHRHKTDLTSYRQHYACKQHSKLDWDYIDKKWADLSSSTTPGQQKQSPAKTRCWTPSQHGTPGPQRCAASPKKCPGHPRFSGWGAKSAPQATGSGGGKLRHQFVNFVIQQNTEKLRH